MYTSRSTVDFYGAVAANTHHVADQHVPATPNTFARSTELNSRSTTRIDSSRFRRQPMQLKLASSSLIDFSTLTDSYTDMTAVMGSSRNPNSRLVSDVSQVTQVKVNSYNLNNLNSMNNVAKRTQNIPSIPPNTANINVLRRSNTNLASPYKAQQNVTRERQSLLQHGGLYWPRMPPVGISRTNTDTALTTSRSRISTVQEAYAQPSFQLQGKSLPHPSPRRVVRIKHEDAMRQGARGDSKKQQVPSASNQELQERIMRWLRDCDETTQEVTPITPVSSESLLIREDILKL